MAALSMQPGTPGTFRYSLEHWILPPLGVATLFLVWALASASGLVPPEFLPGPATVLRKALELTQVPYSGAVLQIHILASLEKFAVAYVLAAIVGVALGLLMGRSRAIEWFVGPIFEAVRFVPPIAWVPFSILWLGTGFLAPTLVIFAGAFSSCVVNAYSGAKLADKALLEAAQTIGAGRWLTLSEVLFPAALPHIIAGLRIGAGFGWQSLIGAELIVGSTGLGYMIVQGESNLAASVVVVGMITIGVIGAIIDISMRKLELWLRHKWHR